MHIVIIGNGISGTTAARHIRKLSQHSVTLISAESILPFSRTALMYIYMGHVPFSQTVLYPSSFFSANKIQRIFARVQRIDLSKKKLLLIPADPTSDNNNPPPTLSYDILIVATGSQYNRFNWPGQEANNVGGLYSLADLRALEQASPSISHAVIVGGGLIGIELAEMLHSRNIHVDFLVREESFWNHVLPPEESQMVNQEIQEHGISLHLSTELEEILVDDSNTCRGVISSQGTQIACQYVGLTAGVHPNISLVADTQLETDKGILVNEYLETNMPNVYAIGDCAQLREPKPGRRPIEAVWYTGKMMGEVVAHTICGKKTAYDPGIWFNSAKFFSIEYQVYGDVPSLITAPYDSLFWQSKDQKRSIRFVFHKDSLEVKGFCVMGVRFRQKMCEEWIRRKASIKEVVQHIHAASFSPEFSDGFASGLRQIYQSKFQEPIEIKGQRSFSFFRKIFQNS